jgi:hypothetical protein
MTETIQQLKEDIALLQMKLQKLEELQRTKSPVEISYKDWWGQYPELETDSEYDEMRWQGFQAGYNASQEPKKEQKWDVVRESVKWCEEHPDESVEDYLKPHTPEQVDAGLRNAMRQAKKDGVFDEPTKPMDEVVDRLVKKYQAQKLWNMVRDELGYSIDCCDEIVDLVEKWLPEPQSAAGSQNVDTELLVDGFNHCLTKIKSKLRNKKDT